MRTLIGTGYHELVRQARLKHSLTDSPTEYERRSVTFDRPEISISDPWISEGFGSDFFDFGGFSTLSPDDGRESEPVYR